MCERIGTINHNWSLSLPHFYFYELCYFKLLVKRMFFKESKEYWEVFPEWDKEKVEEKAQYYNVELNQDTPWNRWATFATVFGREQGLSDLEATSMASIVSGVFGGMPVSCGTEIYFDEDEILYSVVKVFKIISSDFDDDMEVRRRLFDYIFTLYRDFIADYAFKTQRIAVRVNPYEMEEFQSVVGRSNAEKFRALLNFWVEYHP